MENPALLNQESRASAFTKLFDKLGKVALAPYKAAEAIIGVVSEEFRGFVAGGLVLAEVCLGTAATVAALGAGPVAAGATIAATGVAVTETIAAYIAGE